MECVDLVNSDFLEYYREMESGGGREVSAASGYLRYLYFEMFTPHLKSFKGGDYRTLVCGLVLTLDRAVNLCLQEEERSLACCVARDLLDLITDLARFTNRESLIKAANELWVLLDEEELGYEASIEDLTQKVKRGLIDLLRSR